MCGIVGYIGDNATNNAIEGLKSLEYRGYDSAGISFMRDGYAPFVIKSKGRISSLEAKMKAYNTDAPIAVAHTRWSTCGSPSEINAHPHVAGNIAIVHNGIIENYLELKTWLKDFAARTPISETDTEIIAHLIDVSVGDCLYDKVREAVKKLEGSYGLAVISSDDPDTIIVARKKSPLVVGIFEDGAIVASDIHAVLPYTNKVYILDDREVAIVKKNYISIRKDYGNPITEIECKPIEISWSLAETSKGDFSTFMDKEIHEQPVAIYDTMIKNNWGSVASGLHDIFKQNKITNVILTACGTSLHACMVGAMMFETTAQIRSCAKLASELEPSSTMVNQNDLVVAVSQSGETADTLQAIRYAKKRGAKVVSIVNTMGSSIERESDFTIHMAAGQEISVASTKAFVAQLTALSIVAVAIYGIRRGSANAEKIFSDVQKWLYRCADEMDFIFKQEDNIKEIAEELSSAKSILYLGILAE
ncbi:hypothetical protein LCGC14_1830800, partial [marine sediment metagenome]